MSAPSSSPRIGPVLAGGGTRLPARQPVANNHPVRKILPLADYLFMLTRTDMTTISREYLSDDLWLNTVLIETEGMSPLEFHMTPEQKTSLFQSGYQATHNFLPVKLARQREAEA